MIDLPYLPKPKRRLRKGFGCLGLLVAFPLILGCLNILSLKLEQFLPVIVGVLVAITGFFIWFSRQH